jgi:hypothetical protein
MKKIVWIALFFAFNALAAVDSELVCKSDTDPKAEPIRVLQIDPSLIKIRRLGNEPDRYYAFVGKDQGYQLFGEKPSQNEPVKLTIGSRFFVVIDRAEGGTSVTLEGPKLKQSYHCGFEPKIRN